MTDNDRQDSVEGNLRASDDASSRVTPHQALWSCIAAIAIVFVLGVVFFGIDAERAASHRASANLVQPTAPAVLSTTGQGGTMGSRQSGR